MAIGQESSSSARHIEPCGVHHSELTPDRIDELNLCPQCRQPLDHTGPKPGRCFMGFNFRPIDWPTIQEALLRGAALCSSRGLPGEPEDVVALLCRRFVE